MNINNAGAQLLHTELISASHAPGGFGSWENWDISGIITGARYVEVLVKRVSGAADNCGVRKDGSALARYVINVASGEVYFIAEPVSNIIEIYAGADLNWAFYIVGYWS